MANYDNLDEEIKNIVEKADEIVVKEEITKERLATLTKLREEDGRIKHKLLQLEKEINEKTQNIEITNRLQHEYKDYFELIRSYSGQKLLDKLEEEIDGYNWEEYSKIQDRLYYASKDKSVIELQEELDQLKKKYDQYQQKRSDLVDNAILILKDFDDRLSNY